MHEPERRDQPDDPREHQPRRQKRGVAVATTSATSTASARPALHRSAGGYRPNTMNPSLCATNAQQAPPVARQSSAEPDQTASSSAHRTIGIPAAATIAATTTVKDRHRAASPTLRAEARNREGGSDVAGRRRHRVRPTGRRRRRLYAFMAAATTQAERQIDDDHDEHRLDRVAGLVRGRVENARRDPGTRSRQRGSSSS